MGISNSVKKAGAVIISAAMLTSLASCAGLFGGQAVIDAAESLGDAVIAGDSGKIIKLSTEEKDSEIAEALDLLLDDDNYSDDYQAYIDAMKDTMSYEVDKGSVKIDGKKASCDITFTMADFEALDDEDYEDIDDIIDAVGDLDTKDYESWAYGLKKAGYATDPSYPQKLMKIIEENNLSRFDSMTQAQAGRASSRSGSGQSAKPEAPSASQKRSSRTSRAQASSASSPRFT